MGDFSVVLFRPDFVLVSEKNHVKVHKNQWVFDHAISSKRLAGATRRGQTRAPEGQKLSKCPCLTKLPREMCPQLIVSKALSWGVIRKAACLLADITLRKSQIHGEVAAVCVHGLHCPAQRVVEPHLYRHRSPLLPHLALMQVIIEGFCLRERV